MTDKEIKARCEEIKQAMTPEQTQQMYIEQRKSWLRGMMAECEHGVADFEQCGECRK